MPVVNFAFSFDNIVQADLPGILTSWRNASVAGAHAYAGDALVLSDGGFATKGIWTESSDHTSCAHLWIDSLGAGGWLVIAALSGLGVAHAFVAVNAAGRVAVLAADGSTIHAVSPPNVIAARRMFHLEWYMFVSDGDGEARLWVDGVGAAVGSSLTLTGGVSLGVDSVDWRCPEGVASLHVDNWIIVQDMEGAALGPKVLDPVNPDEDISLTNVTPVGTASVFDALDDGPQNGDGTAVGDGIYDARLGLADFPSRDAEEEIRFLVFSLWVRRAQPGPLTSPPYLSFYDGSGSNGHQMNGGVSIPVSVDPVMRQAYIDANPSGGAITEVQLPDYQILWTND